MTTVRKAAIVGTGTMGPGMGAVLERAGVDVALYDVSEEQLDKARPGVELARSVLDRLDSESDGASASLCFESDLAAALDGASPRTRRVSRSRRSPTASSTRSA